MRERIIKVVDEQFFFWYGKMATGGQYMTRVSHIVGQLGHRRTNLRADQAS